jgi:H+/Cl- antiporter ClcA
MKVLKLCCYHTTPLISPLIAQKRKLMAAAAAAGVSVAFGSPLGGVLFGLEGMRDGLHVGQCFHVSPLLQSWICLLTNLMLCGEGLWLRLLRLFLCSGSTHLGQQSLYFFR